VRAKRFFYLLLGCLVIIILLIIGGVYMGTVLMKRSSVKLIQIKLNNIGHDITEQNFLQARKQLDKYRPVGEILQKILPKQKDQALAVKELYKISDETGVQIHSIQFPNSTLGQKAGSTGQSGTGGATANSTLTQAKAVEGMPGVMGIDINLSIKNSVSYDNLINFLQKIELNRRSMQVKSITIGRDSKNEGITANLIITIFVKP